MQDERNGYTEKITQSTASYKVIVAGAGTGKSFTMLKLLEADTNKNYLVLTLTNELINALDADLGEHASCWTLHKLILDIYKTDLQGAKTVYPQFPDVLKKDEKILGLGINLMNGVQTAKDSNHEDVKAYFNRSDYYNAICFDGMTYLVWQYFAKELDKIRVYDLVLIDEFQDFNKLEVELVNVLEARNKLVIVGDDDQSIYSFRGANPQYLREKYRSGKYINFTLPFCCRCTQVIVDAVNTIVEKANVKERIAKEYRCYLPEKKEDSIAYKKIMHKHFTVQGRQQTTNYMGKFISHFYKNRIESSEKENARRQKKTLILIIGPRHYLDQVYPLLVEEVEEENISYRKSKQAKKLIVALKLIKADRNSNLGWRLIAEEKLSSSEFNALIKQSMSDNFLEIIPSELEKTVTNVLILLDQKEYHQKAVQEFLKLHEISQIEMLWDTQDQNKLFEDDEYSQIKLATFEGSKGLAADYVFITGLQEGVLPKTNNATEAEICKFIVALTRTRKQCHIFTCGRFSGTLQKKSFFLNWISEYLFYEKIDKSKINDYQ